MKRVDTKLQDVVAVLPDAEATALGNALRLHHEIDPDLVAVCKQPPNAVVWAPLKSIAIADAIAHGFRQCLRHHDTVGITSHALR